MGIHVANLKPHANAWNGPPRHDCATKRLPSHLDSNPPGSANLDIFRAANQESTGAGINELTRKPRSRTDERDRDFCSRSNSFSAPARHA